MKELKALLKVKSIMTITVMAVFVYLSVTNQLSSELTSSVITAVITYYFTKKEKVDE
ncbi:MAG: hypothetical protein ACLUVC_02070 [Longibaculum sp.]